MTEDAEEKEEGRWQKWLETVRGNMRGRKMRRDSERDKKKKFFFILLLRLQSSKAFLWLLSCLPPSSY